MCAERADEICSITRSHQVVLQQHKLRTLTLEKTRRTLIQLRPRNEPRPMACLLASTRLPLSMSLSA
ncbi:hypothetical protein KCU81_g765, partial [Aureobasidium melanogenum]